MYVYHGYQSLAEEFAILLFNYNPSVLDPLWVIESELHLLSFTRTQINPETIYIYPDRSAAGIVAEIFTTEVLNINNIIS